MTIDKVSPFNWHLRIAEQAQSILGDKVLGMQVNNEPNLYARHGHRPESYSPKDYYTEFGEVIQALEEDERITRVRCLLV